MTVSELPDSLVGKSLAFAGSIDAVYPGL